MMNIEFLKKAAATSLFVLAIALPSNSFAQHRVGAGNAKAPVRKAAPARKPAARGGAVANRPAANRKPAVSNNNRARPGNNGTINRKPGNSRPVVKNNGNRNNNIHVNNNHNNVHIKDYPRGKFSFHHRYFVFRG